MESLLLAAFEHIDFWYSLPLVVAVSLVYAATRHEQMTPILSHAVRIGLWIVGFMAVIFAVLFCVDWLVS